MARYPVSVTIKKTPLKAAPKPVQMPKANPMATKAATQATLRRAERIQREEAGESMLVGKKPQVIRTTVRMKETPAKKK